MFKVWKRLSDLKLGPFRVSGLEEPPSKKRVPPPPRRRGLSAILDSFHQRWLDTTLAKKGWAVVLLPSLALLVCFVGLVSVVLTSESALKGVQSSLQAQSSSQSVLTLTLDAETGVRGYLVTKDSSYLAPFQTAQKNLPSTFTSLSQRLSGDKASLSLISQLKTNVSSEMNLLTNLQQSNGTQASQNTLLGQEKQEITKVRSLVSSLDDRIAAIVAAKEASAHNIADNGLWIALAALILGLAGGAAATQLFTSGISTRIRSLRRSAERLSKGEPPERLLMAKDEVGKLTNAISQASNLLEARALALKEESMFFEHLVSASPVVKFQSNNGLPGNGFVSQNLDRVFALPAKAVAVEGSNWLAAINPDDKSAVITQARSAIEAQSSELVSTYRVTGRDGIQRWVYSTAKLTYDEGDNGPVSALGVLIDITESREAMRALREREEMLRALIDASPDAVLVLSKTGHMKMASSALSKLTGETVSIAAGANLFHYLDPRELIEIEENITRTLSGLEPSFSRRMRLRGSKGWRVVEGHGVSLDSHASEKDLLLILRDVTEHVDMEQQLTAATEAARAANRAKNEFLSRMSHELRTPLNAILGFAQLLELDELGPEQQDSLTQIRRGGQHLLQLINEVLDIARIESGNLAISKEQVGVAEVVDEVCNLLRPLAVVRSIDIAQVSDGKGTEMVMADRQRLRQILLNLISNAIKYNREGGSVTVSHEFDQDTVTLAVSDTGPGISPERIDQVFAPFERLGAEASEIEGTGIGLTLSKQLAEAMGSSLTLESSSLGTTFYLRMPYAGNRNDSDDAGSATLGGGKIGSLLKVLYVEDNPSNVRLMERALNKLGYVELVVSNQGRTAIDLALRNPPDLVLLDLHLPDIEGEEVIQRLAAENATRDTRVVVLSADATESKVKNLLSLGATDYLTKPVDIERLFEVIERARSLSDSIRSNHSS